MLRCFSFFLFLVVGWVAALTDEEVKAMFVKTVMGCLKEHPVEMSEIMKLHQFIVPKDKETKCLLACAYKKEKTMTDKGLYDLEHAYKVAELAKNGDEKRLSNGRKAAEICSKVNEAEVSDGEKGCERAALIFKCTVETFPKMISSIICLGGYLPLTNKA